MPKTIQSQNNPASRIDVGDQVLAAARQIDTKPVKGDLAAFAGRHKEYLAAEAAVRKAAAAKRRQEEIVAALDVEQDRLVARLGVELSADGLPKGNPFAALDKECPPPSKLQQVGYGEEARIAQRLVRAAKARAGLSKRALATAGQLDKAAGAVLVALAPVDRCTKDLGAAIYEREALSQTWETALSTLKSAATYADKKGGTRIHAGLFRSGPERARGKGKARDGKVATEKKGGGGNTPG